jgi:hypothetical protein
MMMSAMYSSFVAAVQEFSIGVKQNGPLIRLGV